MSSRSSLQATLEGAELILRCPVLVTVGGAGGMNAAEESAASRLVLGSLAPLVTRCGAAVVDGGTDAGVMRVWGFARQQAGRFPLIGVAAVGTVSLPGAPTPGAGLEMRHSHVVLVPGTSWGDESPWLRDVATAVSAGRPSVTLVVNGGEITLIDAVLSLAVGRPVVVVSGSGRVSDAIARAARGSREGAQTDALAADPRTRVVGLERPDDVAATVAEFLGF